MYKLLLERTHVHLYSLSQGKSHSPYWLWNRKIWLLGIMARVGVYYTLKRNESESVSHSVESSSLQPARLLCPWSSPGKNIGMGSHALLQRNFLTQGSNPGLLHCRQILSEPQGKPTLKKKEQTTGNNNATNHKCQNIPMWMKCPWSVKKQPVLPAADQLKRLRETKTHSKGFCEWLGIFQL